MDDVLWGQPTSYVKAWMAHEGGDLRQFIDLQDHIFNTDGSATSFNTLLLTTYMTSKNGVMAHPTGFAWFDEVIVSAQPIPDPSGQPVGGGGGDTIPPAAPTNLDGQ